MSILFTVGQLGDFITMFLCSSRYEHGFCMHAMVHMDMYGHVWTCVYVWLTFYHLKGICTTINYNGMGI